MNNRKLWKVAAECCRLLIGITFVFSGFVKSVDPTGSMIKIEEYLAAFGLNCFSWLSALLSFGLSSLEFALGVCMLAGVYRRLTSVGVLLFMAVMTPLTLYLAIFNPVADCGCFGDAWVITNWQTFYKNLILSAAAIIVFIHRRRLTPFFSCKACWFVALFAFFFCIGFCYRNYHHLPIIDFRPYKVGKNIPALMEIPEGAPQDEYHFVYKKDGVKKEFALENVPAGDSTWTFVEAKLVKPGFLPAVSSFELYNAQNDNIADNILHQPKCVFLLIAPKLEQASDRHIDEINNVYDYAVGQGYAFYGVTASSEDGIAAWQKNTGAEYPFLTADDVLLKTMIRSNPGLVLLKEGTILGKWHHNDIPEEDEWPYITGDSITKTSAADVPSDTASLQSEQKNKKEDMQWWYIIAGFALPLSLVWLSDYFYNRKRKTTK